MEKIGIYLSEKIKSKKFFIIVFASIIFIGIFFRTYNFHDWLYFYPDQARDAMIAEDVVGGKTGWPMLGAIAASTPFKIGPMYYYFQIITAKIFGTGPEKMAYPDLLFGILSIPLLYYFLRRLFGSNISLLMMGLYAISFYAIRYSRFAWNPNPMPFFVLLFLISLIEFLYNKEKTEWKWIIITGITLGVGVQLHTILFLLLPAVAFFTFSYLMIKNPRIWKRILVILAIAVFLNTAQIISETKTNFENTRLLFDLSAGASENGGENLLKNLAQDVLCNAQANTAIVSSLGDMDECNFFLNIVRINKGVITLDYGTAIFLVGILLSVVFLLAGLTILFYYYKKEKDARKKYLLGLIILYFILSFIILFPVIDGINLRYFIYLIFMPFVLLAFILKFLYEKYSKPGLFMGIVIVLIFVISNFITIKLEAETHFAKTKSTSTYIVLGELEEMADYIISQSFPITEAHLVGTNKSRLIQNYFKPLDYVLNKKSFDLIRASDEEKIIPGTPAFYIGKALDEESLNDNKEIKNYKNFGQIGIYKIEK